MLRQEPRRSMANFAISSVAVSRRQRTIGWDSWRDLVAVAILDFWKSEAYRVSKSANRRMKLTQASRWAFTRLLPPIKQGWVFLKHVESHFTCNLQRIGRDCNSPFLLGIRCWGAPRKWRKPGRRAFGRRRVIAVEAEALWLVKKQVGQIRSWRRCSRSWDSWPARTGWCRF